MEFVPKMNFLYQNVKKPVIIKKELKNKNIQKNFQFKITNVTQFKSTSSEREDFGFNLNETISMSNF